MQCLRLVCSIIIIIIIDIRDPKSKLKTNFPLNTFISRPKLAVILLKYNILYMYFFTMTYLGNKLVHTILGLFLGTRENLEYEIKSKIIKAGKHVILNCFIIHICNNDYVKYSIFCLIITT